MKVFYKNSKWMESELKLYYRLVDEGQACILYNSKQEMSFLYRDDIINFLFNEKGKVVKISKYYVSADMLVDINPITIKEV